MVGRSALWSSEFPIIGGMQTEVEYYGRETKH